MCIYFVRLRTLHNTHTIWKMTQYLPPNLLALFAPREPIPYLEPLDTLPWEKKPWLYSGVSQYLSLFEVCNEFERKIIYKFNSSYIFVSLYAGP